MNTRTSTFWSHEFWIIRTAICSPCSDLVENYKPLSYNWHKLPKIIIFTQSYINPDCEETYFLKWKWSSNKCITCGGEVYVMVPVYFTQTCAQQIVDN